MMSVDVKYSTKNIDRLMKQLPKQTTFATALALTRTAQEVQKEEHREIKKVFDSPTARTKNATFVIPATKARLSAEVKVKDETDKGTPVSKYLEAQIKGGARRHKGFENRLIEKGMMPANMFAVPTRIIKKNQAGNVSQGQIQKILSGLSAQRDSAQNDYKGSPRGRTAGKYFSGIISGVHGIWDVNKLKNGGAALLFIFVKAPRYKARFDFQGVAKKTIKREFSNQFNKALAFALKTAR